MNEEDHLLDDCYGKYRDLVLRNALMIVKDYYLAEDIAQETFLRLGENADHIFPEKALRWLLRVSENLAKDYLKKGGHYRVTVGLDPDMQEGISRSNTDFSDLSTLIAKKEACSQTGKLLKRLEKERPNWYRTLWMSYYEEMDNRSIGKELGVSPFLVSKWKERGKRWMLEAYKKEEEDEK